MAEKSKYQSLLLKEFERRKGRNSRYTLRSFARQLDVAASTLLQVMNGQRHFRTSTAAKVAGRLGWTERVLQEMVCEIQGSRAGAKTTMFSSQMSFEDIGDWKTMAIAKLATTKDCPADARWLAEKLGVSVPEVEACIDKLRALGLLEIRRECLRSLAPVGPFIISKKSSKAIKYQSDLLTKAQDALAIADENIALSLMQILPFDRRALKNIRSVPWKLSEKVRKASLSQTENQELYCVIVQIFPLTGSQVRAAGLSTSKKRSK